MAKGLFRKITDSVVGKMGYFTVKKEESASFKSIALNQESYYRSQGSIETHGLKKPGKITFNQLKQIAQVDPITRICINVIKKAVSQCDWYIEIPEEFKDSQDYKKRQLEIVELFEHLNDNNENLRMLLDRIIEDILVLDAGAIEVVKTLDGKSIVALNSVDGATIRPIYNQYGELGDPAYYQFIKDKKVATFMKDELIYIMANPQNDVNKFGYGLSPIESIILQVQASLEADMFNMKVFAKDNIPPGMMDLGDMSNEEAKKFIATWNATVRGDTHGLKFVWGGDPKSKRYTPFNTSNKDMQYMEYLDWLSRIKLATYGLTGMDANITQDINRSTGEVQKQISDSRGVQSMKRLIEEIFTRQVIRNLGPDEVYRNLYFKFEEAQSIAEKKTQAEVDKIYADSGIKEINEIRMEKGLEPLEEPDYSEELDAAIRQELSAAAMEEESVNP